MWISFNIYRALTSQVPPSVDKEVSEPLNPTLDKETVDLILGKLFLDDAQIPDSVATGTPVPPVATPTPEATPIETATSAPEATVTPTATP